MSRLRAPRNAAIRPYSELISVSLAESPFLHLFIREIEDMVVRRQRNPVHVLRQFVLCRRDARFYVVLVLQASGFVTLRPELVHRYFVAADAISEFRKKLRLFEQVSPGKYTEALILQACHLQLRIAGKIALTFAG